MDKQYGLRVFFFLCNISFNKSIVLPTLDYYSMLNLSFYVFNFCVTEPKLIINQ